MRATQAALNCAAAEKSADQLEQLQEKNILKNSPQVAVWEGRHQLFDLVG